MVHWAWSDGGFMSPFREKGLLFGCGALDLAGSGVIHVTGGLASLLGVALLGPRDGVTFADGTKKAPRGQSPAFQTLGTLALWFGWFGFNGCSVGGLVGSAGPAAHAMAMTAVSGGTAGIFCAALSFRMDGRTGLEPQVHLSAALNGALSGLVGITANCATVELEGAFLIGCGSAVVYLYSSRALERFGIDDVVQVTPETNIDTNFVVQFTQRDPLRIYPPPPPLGGRGGWGGVGGGG